MRNIDALLNRIASSHASKPKHLFHFTSVKNLDSIRRLGLLSQRNIVEMRLDNVDYASDETSRNSDRKRDLDGHVHLCFFEEHRMAHVAVKEGRIAETVFLRVNPDVLRLPGVLIGAGATNSEDAEVGDVSAMLSKLDWDVIYSYADWNDPAVNQRLQAAQMYEILVPERVATEYLSFS